METMMAIICRSLIVLYAFTVGLAAGNVQRRHVWGECVLPNTGDTNDEFYFYVNTNHPGPDTGDVWELQVRGATNITQSFGGEFVQHPGSGCFGDHDYWYRWGPYKLNVGSHTRFYKEIGTGSSVVEDGPEIVQGEVDECIPHQCGPRAWCEDLPLLGGWNCHCNPGYQGNASNSGGNCTTSAWAHYLDPNTTYTSGVWYDSSNNSRHASGIIGTGPSLLERSLNFTTRQGMRFPDNSIPGNFTIIVVARYYPGGDNDRIFHAVEENDWYLGWNNDTEGVVKYGSSFNETVGVFPADSKFHVIVGRNSHTEDLNGTLWIDGVKQDVQTGGEGGFTLAINDGSTKVSACQVQEVIIFDGHIIDEDIDNTTSTIDVDECATNPCHYSSWCEDHRLPETGYTCHCRTGWVGNASTDGLTCEDWDACESNPCGGVKASCIDDAAPSLGYACLCNAGYDGVPGPDGEGCEDFDACNGTVCRDHSTCQDHLPPSVSFDCPCDSGYTNHTNGTCINQDDCVVNFCGSDNVCEDYLPPDFGYECHCNHSIGYSRSDNLTYCLDTDGCSEEPCGEFQTCFDHVQPDTGRTCECWAEYEFDSSGTCVLKTTETAYPLGSCRAKGNGVVSEPCGFPGDDDCISPLFCSTLSGKCRVPGNGTEGAKCNEAEHADCGSGLTCGQVITKSNTNGTEIIDYVCRTTGNGTLAASCGAVGDIACATDTTCYEDFDTGGFTCQASGDGSIGSLCGDGHTPCATNTTCGIYQYDEKLRCRPKGSGAIGDSCDSADDDTCISSVCATVASTSKRICTVIGTGEDGDPCDKTADARCNHGSICDSTERFCRPGGNGTDGSYCGQPGDAICSTASSLVCAVDGNSQPRCRPAGSGSITQFCGARGDTVCSTTLACSATVDCGQTIPGLDVNAEQVICPNFAYDASCTSDCNVGYQGGPGTFTCDQYSTWAGTLVCEVDDTVGAGTDSKASMLPIYAGAGGGGFFILVIVALILIKRRKANKEDGKYMKPAKRAKKQPSRFSVVGRKLSRVDDLGDSLEHLQNENEFTDTPDERVLPKDGEYVASQFLRSQSAVSINLAAEEEQNYLPRRSSTADILERRISEANVEVDPELNRILDGDFTHYDAQNNEDKQHEDEEEEYTEDYDEHGGFYDEDGVYWDADGYDQYGGYYDEDGNYVPGDAEDEHPEEELVFTGAGFAVVDRADRKDSEVPDRRQSNVSRRDSTIDFTAEDPTPVRRISNDAARRRSSLAAANRKAARTSLLPTVEEHDEVEHDD